MEDLTTAKPEHDDVLHSDVENEGGDQKEQIEQSHSAEDASELYTFTAGIDGKDATPSSASLSTDTATTTAPANTDSSTPVAPPRKHRRVKSDMEEDGDYVMMPRKEVTQLRPCIPTPRSTAIEERTMLGQLMYKLSSRHWVRCSCSFQQGVFNVVSREADATNHIIALAQMKEVRHVAVKTPSSHNNRFQLLTSENCFLFSADSIQDMTAWIMLLGAAIQRYVPSADASPEGGSMANPSKAV